MFARPWCVSLVAVGGGGVGEQVKIQGQNKEMLAAACQMFLGKSESEIAQIALETLEGHQRAIMAHMTVEVRRGRGPDVPLGDGPPPFREEFPFGTPQFPLSPTPATSHTPFNKLHPMEAPPPTRAPPH